MLFSIFFNELTQLGKISYDNTLGTVTSSYGWSVGGFVGDNNNSNAFISNCHSNASVNVGTDGGGVGGFAGGNGNSAVIESCYAEGDISGEDFIGGFVGYNYSGARISGTAEKPCYATGTVTGRDYTGGFAGSSYSSAIVELCYYNGTVGGRNYVGGLIGGNESPVSESFSTGAVTGTNEVGGFAGYNKNTGAVIENSHTLSDVSGENRVGAFAGYNTKAINNCYGAGSVTGNTNTAAFAGYDDGTGTYTACFADTDKEGITSDIVGNVDTDPAGVSGKTTTEMTTESTFTSVGWDFTDIWEMYAGYNDGYPYFLWQFNAPAPPDSPENVQISINEGTVTITWDEATDATSYKVYSSDTLNGEFTEETDGTFDGLSWSKVVSESKKFYHVKAVKSSK